MKYKNGKLVKIGTWVEVKYRIHGKKQSSLLGRYDKVIKYPFSDSSTHHIVTSSGNRWGFTKSLHKEFYARKLTKNEIFMLILES